MKPPKMLALAAASLFALVTARPVLAQPPTATVQALPVHVAGGIGIATAINNSGDIVGVASDASSFRATLWRNGVATDLCPGCEGGYIAYDINDGGQVVGYYQTLTGPGAVPFATVNGVVTALPLPAGYDQAGLAIAITNGGRIVGYATGASGTAGIMWTSAAAAPEVLSLYAVQHVNEAGDIAGVSLNGCGQMRATVLRGGIAEALDPGDDCATSAANSVNDAGVVAGDAPGPTGVRRATIWRGLARTFYDPLPGFTESFTGVKAINDSEDLIGTSYDSSLDWLCAPQATAWLAEGVVALPSPVPGAQGCQPGVAYAINRYAQGVGAVYTPNGSLVPVVWTINVDRRPPTVTAAATDDTIAPPNGRMLPVTFTGSITDDTSVASASYTVTDEYGAIQPSGPIVVNASGQYSVTVLLESKRDPRDRDGRTYTFTATASDPGGHSASASATAAVRVGKPAK